MHVLLESERKECVEKAHRRGADFGGPFGAGPRMTEQCEVSGFVFLVYESGLVTWKLK